MYLILGYCEFACKLFVHSYIHSLCQSFYITGCK